MLCFCQRVWCILSPIYRHPKVLREYETGNVRRVMLRDSTN
jgi:hypothetical protein